jgi:hypothetical protein
MAKKIEQWSEEKAKRVLAERLKRAKEARLPHERRWGLNERIAFNLRGTEPTMPSKNMQWDGTYGGPDLMGSAEYTDAEGTIPNVGSNYVMRNLRLVHSQISANPPIIMPKPLTPDARDQRCATAADAAVHYSLRRFSLKNNTDLWTWYTLLYGSAVLKTQWNPDAGEISGFNPETNEVEMNGDISVDVLSVWNFWPDCDANSWGKVQWVFEKVQMTFEEALHKFPDRGEMIEELANKADGGQDGTVGSYSPLGISSDQQPKWQKLVNCYQYWEKGAPWNGQQGRFMWCLEDGTLLSEPAPSPYRFRRPLTSQEMRLVEQGKLPKEMPGEALLPYHLLTDLDLPGMYWGASTVSYAASDQEYLNRLDSTMLDNIKATGAMKWLIPDDADIDPTAITNNPNEVIVYRAGYRPEYLRPPEIPGTVMTVRQMRRQGIDDSMGVNEAMFGVQSREQATSAMQYAVQQGNMIRRRLFNKFVDAVEQLYKHILGLMQVHYTEDRTIQMIGEERAFESIDFKKADLLGGYDLVVEYGTSFSLDPGIRRQEIMGLMPLFKEAGVPPITLLRLLKFSDLQGIYDRVQIARRRVEEDIKTIAEIKTVVPLQPNMDYKAMLECALEYIMTAEYKYLEAEVQELIQQYTENLKQAATPAQPPASAEPPSPLGALPPIPGLT